MSITCLPVHGKLVIGPGAPVEVTSIGLIQPRPSSPAKNTPSRVCGNFTVEVEAAL
jgi:hypothetical protein